MRNPKDIVLTPMMAVTVILWVAFGFACIFLVCSVAFYFVPDMRDKGTVQGALISGLVAAITGPAAAILQRRQRQEWSTETRKVVASSGITFVASAALLVAGIVLTAMNYANAMPGGYYVAYPGLILVGIAGCMYALLRRS